MFSRLENSEPPVIVVAFKFSSDLSVKIFHNNIVVPTSQFKFLDGSKCNTWSKFDNLISHLYNFHETQSSVDDKLSYILNYYSEVFDEKSGTDLNKPRIMQTHTEQLSLLNKNKNRYSTDLLLFSCSVFYSDPRAYCMLR